MTKFMVKPKRVSTWWWLAYDLPELEEVFRDAIAMIKMTEDFNVEGLGYRCIAKLNPDGSYAFSNGYYIRAEWVTQRSNYYEQGTTERTCLADHAGHGGTEVPPPPFVAHWG